MNRHERRAAKSAKPSDGPWTPEMVEDILYDPAAAGYRGWPAIVDDDMWVRVNAKRIKEVGPERYLHDLLTQLRKYD